jgi:diadenosine tetraphosphate (Ap4A) HIT family hydrolase
MQWPERWYAWRAGDGCPMCQRGPSVVVWRGRHVVEPTELSEEEAAAYGRDVLAVGRALETTFSAVKINDNVLGNWVPHLHTHIVPRYRDDPRPG